MRRGTRKGKKGARGQPGRRTQGDEKGNKEGQEGARGQYSQDTSGELHTGAPVPGAAEEIPHSRQMRKARVHLPGNPAYLSEIEGGVHEEGPVREQPIEERREQREQARAHGGVCLSVLATATYLPPHTRKAQTQ